MNAFRVFFIVRHRMSMCLILCCPVFSFVFVRRRAASCSAVLHVWSYIAVCSVVCLRVGQEVPWCVCCVGMSRRFFVRVVPLIRRLFTNIMGDDHDRISWADLAKEP